MSQEPKNNEEGFMYKLASFIVDKRNLIFLIVAIGLVFSVFSRNWVQVENQLSAYLPKDSETYKGLHLMEDEFITFGTAKIMLVNVTYDEAQAVSERLEAVDGMVRGEIHGQISGIVHAVVEGDVNISLLSGTAEPETADAPQAQTEKEDDAHE